MTRKLLTDLFLSRDENDVKILISLINTHDELFEAIWICTLLCNISKEWVSMEVDYYDYFLSQLAEKFRTTLVDVDEEIDKIVIPDFENELKVGKEILIKEMSE